MKKSAAMPNCKGPSILCRNCVALPHCTLLHRNCDDTALRCRMKVKFILTWNVVTCGRKQSIYRSAPQRNCGVVWTDLNNVPPALCAISRNPMAIVLLFLLHIDLKMVWLCWYCSVIVSTGITHGYKILSHPLATYQQLFSVQNYTDVIHIRQFNT